MSREGKYDYVSTDDLRRWYCDEGKGAREIATLLDIPERSVKCLIRRRNIKVPKDGNVNARRGRYYRSDEFCERASANSALRKFTISAGTLKHMYIDEDLHIATIASRLNVSVGTITNHLRKYGISLPYDLRRYRSVRNANVKGKRTRSRGYVMLMMKGHPGASPSGYVNEHRLVIEEAIGRYLTVGEQVHHLNFNKHDNRLENLVLFHDSAEHTRYHKYLELVGAYASGCTTKPPEPLRYGLPIFYAGRWASAIDATKSEHCVFSVNSGIQTLARQDELSQTIQ